MRVSHLGRRSVVLAALGLGGCGGFLSESGPTRGGVVEGASILIGDAGEQRKLAYALVRISPPILDRLTAADPPLVFSRALVGAPRPTSGAIGIGDFVSITVFEAAAGGLFIPAEPGTRSGNFVNLPTQQVDSSGNIEVPFAGSIHVAGMTPRAVGALLEERLAARALEPQVVVTITDRRANAVSVTGDVNTSAHFVLDPGGERLLGALARAGGPKYPPYESIVTLQRGGDTERAFVSELMRDPSQNVPLVGGDTIFVSRQQRYFLALGALGPGQYLGLVNRRLPFEDSYLSLADAIAKVGGLSDDRANARAVFIYRGEDRDTLIGFGATATPGLAAVVPTVYYLDLIEPSGYFMATKFGVRNEDLIYVSNAPATDLAKFLALILSASYSAANFKTL